MFDHLLESSHRDDSNKWSNIGYGEEMGITKIELLTLSEALFFRMFSKLDTFLNVSKLVLSLSRAPDKVRKMNFNRLYFSHFFTKSYV